MFKNKDKRKKTKIMNKKYKKRRRYQQLNLYLPIRWNRNNLRKFMFTQNVGKKE